MASALFITERFAEANVYFDSIKEHMTGEDAFNWNYGISLAKTGMYKDAEHWLLAVQNESWREDFTYVYWLAKCYIWNDKAGEAWKLYLSTNNSDESFNLLEFVANECYRKGKGGAFLYSVKAFDILLKLEPQNKEYWEGKLGSCAGVLQQVIAGSTSKEDIYEVLKMLRSEDDKPQAIYATRVIEKWVENTKVERIKQAIGGSYGLDDSMSSLEDSGRTAR